MATPSLFLGHNRPGQESTALQVQVCVVVLWLGVTPILPLHVLNVLGSRLSQPMEGFDVVVDARARLESTLIGM